MLYLTYKNRSLDHSGNTAKEEEIMSNQLIWQERFNIGVEIIDSEHKKLFGILNRLFANKTEESKKIGRASCRERV